MNNAAQPPWPLAGRLYAAGIALAGVLFCLAAGLGGAEALCLTQGCSLYQDVQVLGLSLWWWGAGAFAGLLALCLAAPLLWAWRAAAAFVVADCVFLAWMALSVPCVNCLVAACLFFALLAALTLMRGSWHPAVLLPGVLWLMLFTPNAVAVAQELVGPWPIRGQLQDPVRVFFSPSCPACNDALDGLLASGERNLAFFPVAENDEDQLRLQVLQTELDKGQSFANAYAKIRRGTPAPEGVTVPLTLRLNLLRNKVALSRMGFSRIPVLVMQGVPQGFGRSAASPTPSGAPLPGGEGGATPPPGGVFPGAPLTAPQPLFPGLSSGFGGSFRSCAQDPAPGEEDCAETTP